MQIEQKIGTRVAVVHRKVPNKHLGVLAGVEAAAVLFEVRSDKSSVAMDVVQ